MTSETRSFGRHKMHSFGGNELRHTTYQVAAGNAAC